MLHLVQNAELQNAALVETGPKKEYFYNYQIKDLA